VDSCDEERFVDARNELRVILVDSQLKNVPLVLLCNKQDVAGAKPLAVVAQAVLPDASKLKDREVTSLSGSALSGSGVFEALDWLRAHMRRV
jgi:ADP-ribosylation factor-like protein 1